MLTTTHPPQKERKQAVHLPHFLIDYTQVLITNFLLKHILHPV